MHEFTVFILAASFVVLVLAYISETEEKQTQKETRRVKSVAPKSSVVINNMKPGPGVQYSEQWRLPTVDRGVVSFKQAGRSPVIYFTENTDHLIQNKGLAVVFSPRQTGNWDLYLAQIPTLNVRVPNSPVIENVRFSCDTPIYVKLDRGAVEVGIGGKKALSWTVDSSYCPRGLSYVGFGSLGSGKVGIKDIKLFSL